MSLRHQAREAAVKVLFQLEVRPGDWRSPLAYQLREEPLPPPGRKFAEQLLGEVERNRERIDAAISFGSSHWPLDQMGALERAVLRVAVAELLLGDQPVAVVINEAVELAKQMGGADSGRFVNGVLASVARAGAASEGRTTSAGTGANTPGR